MIMHIRFSERIFNPNRYTGLLWNHDAFNVLRRPCCLNVESNKVVYYHLKLMPWSSINLFHKVSQSLPQSAKIESHGIVAYMYTYKYIYITMKTYIFDTHFNLCFLSSWPEYECVHNFHLFRNLKEYRRVLIKWKL